MERHDPSSALSTSGEQQQAGQGQQSHRQHHSLAAHPCCCTNDTRSATLFLSSSPLRSSLNPMLSQLILDSVHSPCDLQSSCRDVCSSTVNSVDWAQTEMGGSGVRRGRWVGKRGEMQSKSSYLDKWKDRAPNCPVAVVSWKNKVKDRGEASPGQQVTTGAAKFRHGPGGEGDALMGGRGLSKTVGCASWLEKEVCIWSPILWSIHAAHVILQI